MLVAAITRTSTLTLSVPPTRLTSRSWRTRRSFACTHALISPISSRKHVPPPAVSMSPRLSGLGTGERPLDGTEQLALEKALGQGAAVYGPNGCSLRRLAEWMA